MYAEKDLVEQLSLERSSYPPRSSTMPIGDRCWKDWTVSLRMWMMQHKIAVVEKTIDEIAQETGTVESPESLHSFGFWNAVRQAKRDWDTIPKNGLDVDFTKNEQGHVERVTFHLNATWRQIMDRRSSVRE